MWMVMICRTKCKKKEIFRRFTRHNAGIRLKRKTRKKVGVVGNPVKIRTGYHPKINIGLYRYIKGLR